MPGVEVGTWTAQVHMIKVWGENAWTVDLGVNSPAPIVRRVEYVVAWVFVWDIVLAPDVLRDPSDLRHPGVPDRQM